MDAVLFWLGKIRSLLAGLLRESVKLWRRVMPPASPERRFEVQQALREASQPDFDYFVMVLLSCIIATLGLLIDSAATIIGAMLVAPLMSPILGLGLSSLLGDTYMLRRASSALLRGALLAIGLAIVIAWFNSHLPFITLQVLPGEILARTRPGPIDLGVALAGGLAATFALVQPNLSAALPGVAIATALMPPLCTIGIGVALGRWDVAGGALLLFITNAVTIAASAIALFFIMGFSRTRHPEEGRVPRSLMVSAILTVLLLAPLGYQSYGFVAQAQRQAFINRVVADEVAKLPDVDLVSLDSQEVDGTLELDLTVRTLNSLRYQDSLALREAIDVQLQQPVELSINQVFAARLDSRIPPTQTPSPILSPTATLPTRTLTPSLTPTSTASSTWTPTPTPGLAVLSDAAGAGVYLRQVPEGPSIGFIAPGDRVQVLSGAQTLDGFVWIQVMDSDGRIGWVQQYLTRQITSTPSPTP